MPSLIRFTRSSFRKTTRPSFQTHVQCRMFSITPFRAVGKESSVHENSEKRAEEAHQTKEEELAKQKKGKNEWREEIASDSESAVRADKGNFDSSKENIKKMQEETKGGK